jgi:hypothetical protein
MAAAVAHGDVQVVVVERMQLIGPKVNPHIVWPKSGICAFDPTWATLTSSPR